jgi:nicotinate dehydrogenase subunit B
MRLLSRRRIVVHGVSALPNTFAHESFIDEQAVAAEVDPIEYPLRYLTDPRAIDLAKAAITNGIFDATGIRFRELPLTPEKVRAALNPLPLPVVEERPVATAKRRWAWPLAGAFAGALATGAAILPWASAISPISRPAADIYSQATIERGRLAAAVGACNVCHVGNDGTPFGGSRALETPFGTIYASNITLDSATGIGTWSYPAFERATRQGVARDGHHLYPAHPYTSFAKASETDLCRHATLSSQIASGAVTRKTELKFPFNIRSLMAGWNALFLSSPAATVDANRKPEWNRGAELVEGLGHCSACHSPRNVLGAEAKGTAHLAGGFADGWGAHALTSASLSPRGWTEQALYDYLRMGRSHKHGAAAGPMAHVIESLQPLPDADI